MVNTHPVQEARRRARSHTPTSSAGMCLREVRECFGVGPAGDYDGDGDADAVDAWERAEIKHHETDPRKIPRGVPVFWTGGSRGHGHIAISTGFKGQCFSTDIVREGYFDQVPIEEIHEKWGLQLVGWTEDLNGVRVYRDQRFQPVREAGVIQPPTPAAKPAKKATARKRAAKKATSATTEGQA